MVRILLDHRSHAPAIGELLGIIFEMQRNSGASAVPRGLTDSEFILACGLPLGGSFLACFSRYHYHAVRDDKRRIETDAKLAN